MVTILLIIAVLVAVGFWVRADFKYRYYKELSEYLSELFDAKTALYENERAWRMTLEVNLQDSRETVSRMIAENARGWAASEASRVVH